MVPLHAGLNQQKCLKEQLDEEEQEEVEEVEVVEAYPSLRTNPETRLQPATPTEEEVEERRRLGTEEGENVQDNRIPRIERSEDGNGETARFDEVEQHRGTDYSPLDSTTTLSTNLSRSKTISRSLVPKIRKMFERARSCDPDVVHGGDGTESSRSSFSQYQLAPSGHQGHAHSVSPAPSTVTISECGSSPSLTRARSKGPAGSNGLITKIKAKFKSSS